MSPPSKPAHHSKRLTENHHAKASDPEAEEEGQSAARQRRSATSTTKDTNLARKFVSDRGKIRARRVTGVTTQQQRQLAKAIKNAREMALLPYTTTGR